MTECMKNITLFLFQIRHERMKVIKMYSSSWGRRQVQRCITRWNCRILKPFRFMLGPYVVHGRDAGASHNLNHRDLDLLLQLSPRYGNALSTRGTSIRTSPLPPSLILHNQGQFCWLRIKEAVESSYPARRTNYSSQYLLLPFLVPKSSSTS